MAEPNTRKMYRLSDPQKLEFLDAFRAMRAEFVRDNLYTPQIAEVLSKQLGYRITQNHVRHAALTLRIELPHGREATGPKPGEQTVIEKVNGQFAQVQQELQTLRGEAGAHSQRYSALEARVTNAVQAQHNLATAIDGLLDRLDRLEKALGGVPA